MEFFFNYLATESANFVLKLKAVGGLFMGGGILPKIHLLLDKDNFVKQFSDSGRLSNLLQGVSIKVILNDQTTPSPSSTEYDQHSYMG
jgi:glucokinase